MYSTNIVTNITKIVKRNGDTNITNIVAERSMGGGGSLTSGLPLQMIDDV